MKVFKGPGTSSSWDLLDNTLQHLLFAQVELTLFRIFSRTLYAFLIISQSQTNRQWCFGAAAQAFMLEVIPAPSGDVVYLKLLGCRHATGWRANKYFEIVLLNCWKDKIWSLLLSAQLLQCDISALGSLYCFHTIFIRSVLIIWMPVCRRHAL